MASGRVREPGDLSRAELVGLAEGLREMMYGDVDDEGNPAWEPSREVSGADLVEWVAEELARLGLVPDAGRRT
jgi:hypothetical protein